MRRLAGLILVLVCTGSAAKAAAAEASVIVLGLRSLEGDDEFANAMTEGLRTAAKTIPGWKLLDRSVSMAQMTLAHGCDDIDAGCLSEIAKGLDADRVVFGTVRRTAAKAKFDYEVTVSVFNDATRTISGTEIETVSRSEAKQKKAIAQHAQMLIGKLSAADANAGHLAIEVNVSTAEVRLDGQIVGQTHEGKLVLDTVTPGDHKLEISAIGHEPHTQTVTISAADQSTVNVNLEPVVEAAAPAPPEATQPTAAVMAESSSGSLNWLGYTLIGVGAASALAWAGSMYMIEFNYNRDATYRSYVNSYNNAHVDACDEALGGNQGSLSAQQFDDFKGQCRTARTFVVLQWVFLGTAAAAAIAGTFVLVSQSGDEHPPQAQARLSPPRLAFTPIVDPKTVALQATLRF
jgi:hypothetical protein